MEETFAPPKQNGMILQTAAALTLAAGCAYAFIQALASQAGVDFVALLALSLVLAAPLPLLLYRIFALLGARYALERDGIRLHWGLRTEVIPMPQVEWIREAGDLAVRLPMPWLSWPGAILGARSIEGLGPVEFLASAREQLVLIATPQRIYAISPTDPRALQRAFQDASELGSLVPLPSQSVYPALLVGSVWQDRWARALVLAGLFLGLALAVWVLLAIPAMPVLAVGFQPNGLPVEASGSERLLLLPVLNGVYFLADLAGGLFFFRRPGRRLLAYLLWGASALTGLLLVAAVGFITL